MLKVHALLIWYDWSELSNNSGFQNFWMESAKVRHRNFRRRFCIFGFELMNVVESLWRREFRNHLVNKTWWRRKEGRRTKSWRQFVIIICLLLSQRVLLITLERFQSPGQRPCKSTKGIVLIRKEFNSADTGLIWYTKMAAVSLFWPH